MDIGFYGWKNEYGEFSNFYPCSFEIDGIKFSSTEQAFMWNKAHLFQDKEMESKILATTNPASVKKYGRLVKNFNDSVWTKVRQDIMYQVNLAKFSQNPKLKELLLSTGDAHLYEDSPTDYVWGVGANGTGQNLLGKTLMKVREQLRIS